MVGIVLINTKEEETDVTKKQTKVGMILNGSINDKSWGTSHYTGMEKCALKYPDIYFFHATGVEEGNNLSTYFGRMYQIRYLSGIVAGLQTQTNEIGM